MATPYLRNYYAGGGTSTTLNNAMGTFDGSFVIAADTGWPGGAGFFTVVVDRGTSSEEKIRCASNSGTTVTVASDGNGGRGYDGTSATSHNSGATVSLCGTSVDFDQANQVVTQVLGQSGAAKGDLSVILSAAGPVTLARLGVGANGSVLSAASATPAYSLAGTSGMLLQSAGSAVPTWIVPPGYLLATQPYTATSTKTLNTSALTAIDTTNLTLAFTVPANGIVDVVVEALWTNPNVGSVINAALLNHSGGAQVGNTHCVIAGAAGSASAGLVTTRFHLTGLTPGALQLDLAALAQTSGSLLNGTTNAASPSLMQAFASV